MGEIGNKMKQIRTSRDMTQQDIAEAMGVSRVYYSQWENGTRNINAEQLIQFAQIMHITLDFFSDKKVEKTEFDILQYLKMYFASENTSDKAKDMLYQKVMRLYLNFKESKSVAKYDNVMPIAAHNDAELDEKELKLMQEDIDEL